MDRVDDLVQAALQEIWPQLAREVLAVVAALVIVFDRDVVVAQQALCDDEIVRLARAGSYRRRGPQPETDIGGKARREHEPPSRQPHPRDDARPRQAR